MGLQASGGIAGHLTPVESGRVCGTCSPRQAGCGAVLLFSEDGVDLASHQFTGALPFPGDEALP